ncbi:MAG: nucleotidyltransferase family protein [Alphaproteobacteria bacterium]|nr:nucleotidyltransferase family protein [Alphaproteobacteria bacterium]
MTQAIILAGGFGTRLRSAVQDLPKPMAPINGKPFLSFLLDEIYSQGIIKEIILSVHYKHEAISSFFKDSYKGLPLKYVIESNPLGTGGAIKNCADLINPEQSFFVFNGDTFLKFSQKEMYDLHCQKSCSITLALKNMSNCYRYGRVLFNEEKHIMAFDAAGYEGAGYINAGVYLLSSEVLKILPDSTFSFEKDFLEKCFDRFSPLGFLCQDYFIDIGIPEDYRRAAHEFSAK